MLGKLFFAALCSLFLGSALGAVNVEIYYETYNEHVRKFMVEQFGPLERTLSQFGNNVKLRFYPYGGTSPVPPDNKFICPDGQMQCYANAIHACYLGYDIMEIETNAWPNDNYLPNGQQSMTSMVACFFKNQKNMDDPKALALSCGANYNNNYVRCTSGLNSDYKDLTMYFYQKTRSAPTRNGLAVKINDEFGDDPENNLIGKICAELGSDATPNICKPTPPPLVKPKVTVFYEANHLASGRYFTKQLFPYNQALEDFVDIELVPYGSINLDQSAYQCIDGPSKHKCQSTVFQALVVNKYTSTELGGDLISGTNRAINFINCVSDQDVCENLFDTLQKCSNDNLEFDEYRNILTFMRQGDDEYKQIMKNFKDKTIAALGISADYRPVLPLVRVNGKNNTNAYKDIVLEACSLYQGPLKPTICKKVTVDVLYQPMDHKTRSVFLKTIKPLFDNLQNVVDFNFIPAGNLKLKPNGSLERMFDCPTPELCDSLRYQACIIDKYWNKGDTYLIRQDVFDIVPCMLKNEMRFGVQENAKACSELIDGWSDIELCHKKQADRILSENLKLTNGLLVQAGLDINLVEFPVILYQKHEHVKPADLKAKICNNFDKHHVPNFCDKRTPLKLKPKQKRRMGE